MQNRDKAEPGRTQGVIDESDNIAAAAQPLSRKVAMPDGNFSVDQSNPAEVASAPAQPSPQLARLIDRYLSARQAYNECLAGPDSSDEHSDPFHDANWHAYEAVFNEPAVTVDDLLHKLLILARETACIGFEPPQSYLEPFFEDVCRLTGMLPPLPDGTPPREDDRHWWPKGCASMNTMRTPASVPSEAMAALFDEFRQARTALYEVWGRELPDSDPDAIAAKARDTAAEEAISQFKPRTWDDFAYWAAAFAQNYVVLDVDITAESVRQLCQHVCDLSGVMPVVNPDEINGGGAEWWPVTTADAPTGSLDCGVSYTRRGPEPEHLAKAQWKALDRVNDRLNQIWPLIELIAFIEENGHHEGKVVWDWLADVNDLLKERTQRLRVELREMQDDAGAGRPLP